MSRELSLHRDSEDPDRREDERDAEQGEDEDHRTRSPSRGPIAGFPRLLRVFLATALVGAIAAGSVTVNIGLLTLEPGPTASAIDLVTIEGARTYAPQGQFLLTTVTLYEASLVRAVRGWVSREVDVVPRSAFYPPGSTDEDINRQTASQMDQSQFQAAVAALRVLGYQLPLRGALVIQTLEGTPAGKTLIAGDAIIEVDGVRVNEVQEIQGLITARGVGEVVEISVLRGGGVETFGLHTAADEDGGSAIGVEVIQNYELPFAVKIEAGNIGGPSAGLTFALAITELLGPEDLTGGRVIADTGTIDDMGRVGAVGGIPQKVAAAQAQGADVFLVPSSQLDKAQAVATSDMLIIGVSTLQEAVDALLSLP